MPNTATVTTAEMKRAIKAAEECGLTICEAIVSKRQVRLLFQPLDEAKPKANNQAPLAWPEAEQ
nr:hypothetical protein [uncultured Cohaesibacter sp.]